MLKNFIKGFNGLKHISVFCFGTILSESADHPGQLRGNILGEYLVEEGISSTKDIDSVLMHQGFNGFFTDTFFSYPIESWAGLCTGHPDYDGSIRCSELLHRKLLLCSNYWTEMGFIIPIPGSNDDVHTQQRNLINFTKLGPVNRTELFNVSNQILYTSGYFGKNFNSEAIFN